MFKSIFFNNRIKTRLFQYFLSTIILVGMAGLFSFFSTSNLLVQIRSLFIENVKMNNLNTNLIENENLLQLYLSTNNMSVLEDYNKKMQNLESVAQTLSSGEITDSDLLMQRNISVLLEKYIKKNEDLINKNQSGSKKDLTASYNEVVQAGELIRFAIDKLLTNEYQKNASKYYTTFENIYSILLINMVVIIIAIIIGVVLVSWFSNKLSTPLVNLTMYANKVAEGDFSLDKINVSSYNEINQMANSLNIMVANINKYIHDLNERVKIEKEQEIENLKMQNLLRLSQQQALQSQINPHFLYNTLNAGSQLAILENADRTGEFLVVVANLFRYNLSNIDSLVTIQNELKHAEMYLFIMNARFPNKIKVIKEIDETLLNILIPRMIIQPILENVYIHGFNEMEKGCEIIIRVRKVNKHVEIMISDNGAGMDKQKIDSIMINNNLGTHASGIGLGNIIQRMKLYYKKDNLINIISEIGKGTTVTVLIPGKKRLVRYV